MVNSKDLSVWGFSLSRKQYLKVRKRINFLWNSGIMHVISELRTPKHASKIGYFTSHYLNNDAIRNDKNINGDLYIYPTGSLKV